MLSKYNTLQTQRPLALSGNNLQFMLKHLLFPHLSASLLCYCQDISASYSGLADSNNDRMLSLQLLTVTYGQNIY